MLSFRAFLDDELIHRFIFRFAQDKYFGYLKENFSESLQNHVWKYAWRIHQAVPTDTAEHQVLQKL